MLPVIINELIINEDLAFYVASVCMNRILYLICLRAEFELTAVAPFLDNIIST